jgi:type 1 glutamine amidotransferase
MKFIALGLLLLPWVASAQLVYPGGEGIGKGKHIVFLASDHEYRSEETCPAMARILSKHHGFQCTVVFGLDGEGNIEAGSSKIPGIDALKDADLFFIFARFLSPSAEQMQPIIDYIDRGGPVVGLRTSSHAFKIAKDSPLAKYSFDSKVEGYEKGFGHQVLGNTWVGHYGDNHKQGTRIQLIPEQKEHPILRGVKDGAFTHAGAYVGKAAPDFTVLANSQPMVTMDPQAALDAKKPPMPCTWTREYLSASGKKGRVFHSTQGASEDIVDDNYRRMIFNGTLWAIGLEDQIKPDLTISFVGPYQPRTFSFKGEAKGVKPADLQGYESPILPQKEEAKK